ncbi:MAG: ATP-binding protein [Desulfobacterales bacterium]|nr:ATP-binding protein [Desulfobacterales bacterium]
MRKVKLIWLLFPANALILLGAILLIALYGGQSLKLFYVNQTAAQLEAQSRLVEREVTRLLQDNRRADLNSFFAEVGQRTSARITLVDQQGKVLNDTAHDPRKMENHGGRPEIIQAMAGRVGRSKRYSTTIGQDMLYVAIPLMEKGSIRGVLRASIPLTAIDNTLRGFFYRVGLGLLVIAGLAAGITLFVSRKVSRPLQMMRQGAMQFAAGDFSKKISVSGSEEIVGLAQSMNSMAAHLDDRIRAVVSQRNELETVLSSMGEGVIAVDLDANVVYMNGSAARQLGVDQWKVQGRNILEVVRNIDLLHFIQKTLAEDGPSEGSLVFNRGREGERILQLRGAQLFDARKTRHGALIVMNDVTRLLRLENIRRDFVANVSHELKTPITSIKGYVETLLDETGDGPAQVRDFLEIIHKHANRLQAIVEDLLTLSKIEQDDEREMIPLARETIKNVLRAAIEVCSAKAAEKNINITLQCDDSLAAAINRHLLEQACINLIDNAVKYSGPGSKVQVEAETTGTDLLIRVRDTGPGIAAEHLDRLFERFYIVDKARSRKLGGTGLGLAIVKHIARAHGGRVTVQSELEKGTVFTIHLPRV